MAFADNALALVQLALKAGDVYSAAAVHKIATGAVKKQLEKIMFGKRKDALLLARWEHTPASVLEALASASENVTDNAIVVRLDKNPNTPAHALSQLYENSGVVSKASPNLTILIAQHPHAPLGILKKIAQFDDEVAHLLAVSKNKAADAAILSVLLKSFAAGKMRSVLQKNLAEHPASSAALLEQIYEKGDAYVRAAVVGHQHCSQQLIASVAQEKDVLILRQLAANKGLNVDVIVRLSVHQEASVRCAVAANPSAPKSIIQLLTRDDSHTVRRAIAARSDLATSSILTLMHDPDSWVRQKLARNPITPIKVLEALAKDKQVDVRRGVARNARCTVKLLNILAKDSSDWVRAAVAYQYKSPTKLLEKLAEDVSVDVLSGVANNPNTHQRLLKKLATSSEADIRRGVILNKRASRTTLLPLLEDAYYLHRLMLVANNQLKDTDKQHLCVDPDFQVRFTAFRYFANGFIKSSH